MWLRRLATRPDLAGGSRSLAELVSDRAGVDAVRGDWARVAEAYGKFDALTTELRPYFPNALWAFHDRTREDATSELGAEAFGRHHEAGARMTYAETVEFLVA